MGMTYSNQYFAIGLYWRCEWSFICNKQLWRIGVGPLVISAVRI
jgi:hypothetical protein